MNFIEKYNNKKNIRFKLFKKTLEIAERRGLKIIVETGTSSRRFASVIQYSRY